MFSRPFLMLLLSHAVYSLHLCFPSLKRKRKKENSFSSLAASYRSLVDKVTITLATPQRQDDAADNDEAYQSNISSTRRLKKNPEREKTTLFSGDYSLKESGGLVWGERRCVQVQVLLCLYQHFESEQSLSQCMSLSAPGERSVLMSQSLKTSDGGSTIF